MSADTQGARFLFNFLPWKLGSLGSFCQLGASNICYQDEKK